VTAISLVSFSGAPGATTVALATAAALTNALSDEVGEPVLVEMAVSGGVVAGWYDLPAEPGLSTLALAIGNEAPELLAHAQELPGGLPAVVAPPSGSRVTKLLGARAAALAAYLRETEATVVADCGRVSVDTPLRPILESSTLVGVVIRPTREDFRLAATALAELNTVAASPLPAGWILIGESPWSVEEILGQYGLPVLATIAEDHNGADAVAGRRRFRRHAPLSRSVQSFADDIVKHLRVASADDPLSYLRSNPDSNTEPSRNPGPAAEAEPAEPRSDGVPHDEVTGQAGLDQEHEHGVEYEPAEGLDPESMAGPESPTMAPSTPPRTGEQVS